MKNKTLFLLVVLFLSPIILGSIFFYFSSNIFIKSINYGKIIHPVFSLNSTDLYKIKNGKKEYFNNLNKWIFLYVNQGKCLNQCNQDLKLMSSIKILLNKNSNRVHLLTPASFNFKIKDIEKVNISNSFKKKILAYKKGRFFIIDPQARIMMYYPYKEIAKKKILQDFKRLLKYSQIG